MNEYSTTKDLGAVTAYASAVEGGYKGTYEEFCDLLGNFTARAGEVKTDRTAAEKALDSTKEYAAAAEKSKDAAAVSQNAASSSANGAAGSATAAKTSESNAAASAKAAGTSETNAAASAKAAATSEANAMSATPDGYASLADTFNKLGLYVDDDGDVCQKD